MTLLTIAQNTTHEIIIDRSRFICHLKKVETEEEAQEYIKALKKEYWDANHNCSAYIIGENMEHQRSSDDGEPSGTAGVPMLEVLKKRELHNLVAVVTRYFGGIKLGAGGLIRAYGRSVSEAIDQSGIAKKELIGSFTFSEDPQDAGKTLNLLYTQKGFTIENVDYAARTTFTLQFKAELKEQIEKSLTQLLSKSIELTLVKEKYVELLLHSIRETGE